eukprot:19013-Chlamydomonas_euryale.AAC.1
MCHAFVRPVPRGPDRRPDLTLWHTAAAAARVAVGAAAVAAVANFEATRIEAVVAARLRRAAVTAVRRRRPIAPKESRCRA